MLFTFHNNVHNTTARASTKDYRLSQRQAKRIWKHLCGEVDCPTCDIFGMDGSGRYRLKKGLFCERAEIVFNS